MLSPRGVHLFRMLNNPTFKQVITSNVANTRNSGTWSYRVSATIPKKIHLAADLVGGVMFWWILWHIYHDYGHIIGEFEYPDPKSWTNAELGIPPDDE